MVEQHQRHEPDCFGFVGHQLDERALEAYGFGGEVDAAAAPAFVEDQVYDGEDGVEPLWQHVRGRDLERDVRVADLVLRTCEALAHRLERDEKRARDLLGREAAERAQGEGDLGVERERRVTAGEDQLEALVGEC